MPTFFWFACWAETQRQDAALPTPVPPGLWEGMASVGSMVGGAGRWSVIFHLCCVKAKRSGALGRMQLWESGKPGPVVHRWCSLAGPQTPHSAREGAGRLSEARYRMPGSLGSSKITHQNILRGVGSLESLLSETPSGLPLCQSTQQIYCSIYSLNT